MWGHTPQPAPAPETSHNSPPEDLSPSAYRLHYRPRDIYDCGIGPWRECWFGTHDARVLFVKTWQHDFGAETPRRPLES
jgi:hypothetical protein